MNNDIALFYYGGCGGQIVFHLLNTLDGYRAVFKKSKKDYNFSEVVSYQWNNIDKEKWKKSEIWPKNDLTRQRIDDKRLYLYCNDAQDFLHNDAKTKIVLYTDYFTHINLAFFKKAHWFHKDYMELDVVSCAFVDSYNNVKDDSWPEVNDIEDFKKLDKSIQSELTLIFNFSPEIFTQTPFDSEKIRRLHFHRMNHSLEDSKKYKNINVFKNYITDGLFDIATHIVLLQDVVSTDGKILFSQLNLPYDKKLAKNIVKKWIKLHPTNLMENLNWKP